MLGDKRLIQAIELQKFLSSGPDAGEIELKSLDLLTGPNASRKSNIAPRQSLYGTYKKTQLC